MAGAENTRQPGRLARLGAFFAAEHRYVFLGTSVLALIGIWFSMQPRSEWSFLKGVYALEVLLYWLLVAWVVVSLAALASKIALRDAYAERSPFAKPAARRAERLCSYAIWAIVLVFFLDRAVMGFADVVAVSIAADRNPSDDLSSAVYMVYKSLDIYGRGILITIGLATFGTVIAFFLAILLVFARIQLCDRQDNDFVRFWKKVGVGFAKVYSTVIRGTPMMVQGLIIYFGGMGIFRGMGMTATEAGRIWSTFNAGLVTISLNSTAYMMEVLRGGIEAVDPGQAEAARSLGLSQWQAMRKVVFPQGIKNSIPALSNELVINIKDSSVLSVIGVFDLMFATTTVAGIYARQMPVYYVTALVYLCLTMFATYLLNKLSVRLGAPVSQGVPSSN